MKMNKKRWTVLGFVGLTIGSICATVFAAGYDGCATNKARIAIRLSGNAQTYPSCNLQQCVVANPNQRVKLYSWVGFPPAWEQVAEYRSHYGALNPNSPTCPSYVENANWVH